MYLTYQLPHIDVSPSESSPLSASLELFDSCCSLTPMEAAYRSVSVASRSVASYRVKGRNTIHPNTSPLNDLLSGKTRLSASKSASPSWRRLLSRPCRCLPWSKVSCLPGHTSHLGPSSQNLEIWPLSRQLKQICLFCKSSTLPSRSRLNTWLQSLVECI